MSKSCSEHFRKLSEVSEQFNQIGRTRSLKLDPKLTSSLTDINLAKIDQLIISKCYSCKNGDCKQ